ncbi:MAG: TRAP transporter small permease subunit, partial [Betaproteobacteria bacterium]|nr:TRAP transporter small permease subunit [Betaproteobacteria bacterium]
MMQILRRLLQADNVLASIALVLMALIPLVEILSRPVMGKGIENASVVVQHLGLVMAMCGAIAAERFGHLTSLGVLWPRFYALGQFISAMVCGVLAWASAQLVLSEMSAQQVLAYGVPVWCVQLAMPIGFSLLGMKLGARCSERISMQTLCAVLAPASGALVAFAFDGQALPLLPSLLMLLLMAVLGA